ncbi:MAG TPA: hypothetical protein VFR58_00810 [Flavisolibacter sp.]|nr:hypothetical protein [Flavisolibacter sp.]
MKVDLFVSTDAQPLPYPSGYGLIESIDFIPTLHSYWYNTSTGRVYEIVSMLQTRDRTVAICIERQFDASAILSIPGAAGAPSVCYPSCPPPAPTE